MKRKPVKFTEQQIDEIIGKLDYDRIHQTMLALNWKWEHRSPSGGRPWTRIPSIRHMKKRNRWLIHLLLRERCQELQTGGFSVRWRGKQLVLEFVVADADLRVEASK